MAEGETRAYTFRSTVREQDDGRWSAWLDSIPACSTWGHTREEALAALQEAAELLVEHLIASGEEIPIDDEAIAVVCLSGRGDKNLDTVARLGE